MTKALYFTDMEQMSCTAQAQSHEKHDEYDVIVLDQTVFYPQGGGQPSDTGTISWEGGHMDVQKVFWSEDQIVHTGQITGELPQEGTSVECEVDAEKRHLHMKLHSAGHLIDMALTELGSILKPEKGYHFPDGPYVEYLGTVVPEEQDSFIASLKATINALIKQNHHSRIEVQGGGDEGKVRRKIYFGDYVVPCGGTHVAELSEIRGIEIRKVKNKKDHVKISYELVKS